MAFVTGGLGGLGMLAANELSAGGKKQVVTTSRTGYATAMRPELMQIMSSMQQNSMHYSVKADGSDGATMLDTLKVFCSSSSLQGQTQIYITDIIANLTNKMKSVPQELVKPVLDTMERIKHELAEMTAEIQASGNAQTSADQVKELRDREAQVSELIGKLHDKLGGKASAAALKDGGKTAANLAGEVSDMHSHQREMLSGPPANVTDEEAADVNEILTGIRAKPVLPPEYIGVECVVHAAGVLADGLIMTSTNNLPAGMSKVYGAKAHGAWQLYHAMGSM